jgi:hypothetical protein
MRTFHSKNSCPFFLHVFKFTCSSALSHSFASVPLSVFHIFYTYISSLKRLHAHIAQVWLKININMYDLLPKYRLQRVGPQRSSWDQRHPRQDPTNTLIIMDKLCHSEIETKNARNFVFANAPLLKGTFKRISVKNSVAICAAFWKVFCFICRETFESHRCPN